LKVTNRFVVQSWIFVKSLFRESAVSFGLVISDNRSWEKHIDTIAEKAYKRINILRKFKFILDRKTLEKIYLTFVRPLLAYANVIWDNMSMSLNKKIENV
jgi:hypothetical protein